MRGGGGGREEWERGGGLFSLFRIGFLVFVVVFVVVEEACLKRDGPCVLPCCRGHPQEGQNMLVAGFK